MCFSTAQTKWSNAELTENTEARVVVRGGAKEAEAIHIIRFLFVPNRRIDRGAAL